MKMYLYVNHAELLVAKDSIYVRRTGWVLYGRYQDGTSQDIQNLDNDRIDLINQGYIASELPPCTQKLSIDARLNKVFC